MLVYFLTSAFNGLVQLQVLKLARANLTKFPNRPLAALPQLRHFELRDMPFIQEIPAHSFK